MRFDTNLYEERQYWIQNLCEELTKVPTIQKLPGGSAPFDYMKAVIAKDNARLAKLAKLNRLKAIFASGGIGALYAALGYGAEHHADELNKASLQHAADIVAGSRHPLGGLGLATVMR
jgi:hypothetical protein